MFARELLSLHTAQLPVRTPLVAKSRVSATSKLIETKGLQVPYFGHLRKTGGGGVTGWYRPGGSLTDWTARIPDIVNVWQALGRRRVALTTRLKIRKSRYCLS